MFLVFNKQKIISYIIAFSSVVVLFGMARLYTNKSDEIIETVSKSKEIESCIVLNNWNQEDAEMLLQLLNKNGTKMKFYVDNEWKNQHSELIKRLENEGYEVVDE